MLGRRRVRPRQQRTPLGVLRAGGPDLLTSDAPATVDPGGLGCQASQVRSRARLGEQLAPENVASERWRQEALLLIVGSERDDRRHDPRRDGNLRPLDPPGGELLGDDDLLDRAGGPTPRLGQIWQHPPTFGDRDSARLSRHRLQRGDFGPDLGPQLLGRGVQVDVYRTHTGSRRGVHHPLRILRAAAKARGQHQRPAVVDVRVMLPGEADAAVHLNAVLRAALSGRRCQRRRHRRREFDVGARFARVV
ncbi:Uncharacterised protein [Mycobacterium tuberculosis]|nr:Uncharacterised protein [Mycobacterium tuberculosis]